MKASSDCEMNIVIIGAGVVGQSLAEQLTVEGHRSDQHVHGQLALAGGRRPLRFDTFPPMDQANSVAEATGPGQPQPIVPLASMTSTAGVLRRMLFDFANCPIVPKSELGPDPASLTRD